MGTSFVTVGLVLAVIVAGSLLAPVPKRWAQGAAPLTFWRRASIRRRLQERRPLALIYLGLVAAAAIVLVIWVLPSVLTKHPSLTSPQDRHKAITDTRTSLVAMLAAIGAAGGLAYTARTYRLSREGHITDRYSKAVEQLGDEKIEVRLGGIYALERLMRDSPADQPTIMETLAAFVRQHAPYSSGSALLARSFTPAASDHPAEDVQAVLTVLGRRHPVDNERPINLRSTNLAGADLRGAPLIRADLTGVNLTRAILFEADLADARLTRVTFIGADLRLVTFTGADLREATLTEAYLIGADLTDAKLVSANLTDAKLTRANLNRAELSMAILVRAHLMEATLTSADLRKANMTRASLAGANGTYAVFRGASLTDAILRRATLTSGSLSEQQLASVKYADEIVWGPPHQSWFSPK